MSAGLTMRVRKQSPNVDDARPAVVKPQERRAPVRGQPHRSDPCLRMVEREYPPGVGGILYRGGPAAAGQVNGEHGQGNSDGHHGHQYGQAHPQTFGRPVRAGRV